MKMITLFVIFMITDTKDACRRIKVEDYPPNYGRLGFGFVAIPYPKQCRDEIYGTA